MDRLEQNKETAKAFYPHIKSRPFTRARRAVRGRRVRAGILQHDVVWYLALSLALHLAPRSAGTGNVAGTIKLVSPRSHP